jgi:DNA helicase-2/ATP-dependent DNA helicase PcrA
MLKKVVLLLEQFSKKMQNQMNNGDFAILYRTNAQSRSMEDALRKRDIPTAFMVDCLLPEERNKRCIVLFTISYQSKDEEAFDAVINYPARGIGNTTIEKLLVAANHYKRSILRLCKTLIKLT